MFEPDCTSAVTRRSSRVRKGAGAGKRKADTQTPHDDEVLSHPLFDDVVLFFRNTVRVSFVQATSKFGLTRSDVDQLTQDLLRRHVICRAPDNTWLLQPAREQLTDAEAQRREQQTLIAAAQHRRRQRRLRRRRAARQMQLRDSSSNNSSNNNTNDDDDDDDEATPVQSTDGRMSRPKSKRNAARRAANKPTLTDPLFIDNSSDDDAKIDLQNSGDYEDLGSSSDDDDDDDASELHGLYGWASDSDTRTYRRTTGRKRRRAVRPKIAYEEPRRSRSKSKKRDNKDEFCTVCEDGGQLLICGDVRKRCCCCCCCCICMFEKLFHRSLSQCPKVFHLGCLVPPLVHAPEGAWACPICAPPLCAICDDLAGEPPKPDKLQQATSNSTSDNANTSTTTVTKESTLTDKSTSVDKQDETEPTSAGASKVKDKKHFSLFFRGFVKNRSKRNYCAIVESHQFTSVCCMPALSAGRTRSMFDH